MFTVTGDGQEARRGWEVRRQQDPALAEAQLAGLAALEDAYAGRALDAVRRGGEVIPDALLVHLAPLGWQHINLTGDYLWGAGSMFGPDRFRLLRGMSAEPFAAAA